MFVVLISTFAVSLSYFVVFVSIAFNLILLITGLLSTGGFSARDFDFIFFSWKMSNYKMYITLF